MMHLNLQLWTYFERDPALGGAWVAHVLPLDLVTQGATLQDAMEMARDAAAEILIDDLRRGKDPFERGKSADFGKLMDLLSKHPGQPLVDVVSGEKEFTRVATIIVVSLESDDDEHAEAPSASDPLSFAWPEELVA